MVVGLLKTEKALKGLGGKFSSQVKPRTFSSKLIPVPLRRALAISAGGVDQAGGIDELVATVDFATRFRRRDRTATMPAATFETARIVDHWDPAKELGW